MHDYSVFDFVIDGEVFNCFLEIFEGDTAHEVYPMNGFAISIQTQFINLMMRAGDSPVPIKIKLFRTESVWDQFENKPSENEYSITFMNNAWLAEHEEDRCE